ncbi:MAG: MarR family transcriptional regulator [Aggregatilineales bacterium]
MKIPPLHTQNDFLMFAIHKIAHGMWLRADSELEAFGLSRAKMWALMQIRFAENPMGISQLAECIGSGKSNATQLIDRMEAEGLVQRTQNPNDRRSVILEITEEGLQRMNRAEALRSELMEQVFSPLTQEERDTLKTLVDKLADAMDMPAIIPPMKME